MFDLGKLPPEVWDEGFGEVHATLPRMVEAALAERPAEITTLVEALRTGEVAAWFEEFAGLEPDPVLREALRAWLFDEDGKPRSRKVSIFGMVRLTRYHRRRLRRLLDAPHGEWYRERAAEVAAKLKKSPGSRLMQSLEGYGGEGAQKRALDSLLPGGVITAEARGHYLGDGGKLVGAAESIIIKENRLLERTRKVLRDKDRTLLRNRRGEVVAYQVVPGGGMSEALDPRALLEYEEMENDLVVAHLAAQANLTAREEEVFRLTMQGLRPADIADYLGTKPSTIRGQQRDIHDKFRATLP